MAAFLDIHILMNSSAEDILAFKTCCGLKASDQNFEVHVKNMGRTPVTVPSHLDLIGEFGTKRIDYLMPGGGQTLAPGEIKAFYCTMDELVWRQTRELVMFDGEGNRYLVSVSHETE